ncbi:MAG: hypothetical protein KJ626_14685, partial [Verrucomicrobia bacterium]|nr:hypothetical protein [Verrucomicrobiota bacterium]
GTGVTVHSSSASNDFSNAETASFVYHDPNNQDDTGNRQFWPNPTNAADQQIWLEVKTGHQFDINKVFIYYTTDGMSWPEGAGGEGIGNTEVQELTWHHSDTNGVEIDDWWGNNPLPAMPAGTVLRYKISAFKVQNGDTNAIPYIPWSVKFPNSEYDINVKKTMMGVWEVTNINAGTINYRPHVDYSTISTGLVEGFHVVRARAFLQRNGAGEGNGNRSPIYNTFTQPFYLDAETPKGEIVWPKENETLWDNRYGVVVRTDPTVTKVYYHIEDANAQNDDGQTGERLGNGTNALGEWAWAEATEVSASMEIDSDYPQEWRFDYNNVAPSNSSAAIYVKLAELTSSTNAVLDDVSGHFTTLTRNVNANGPAYTMFVAWPHNDGDEVGVPYTLKVNFSGALWDVDHETTKNRFLITIDDEVQGRENYNLTWYGAGDYHELSFDLPDLYNGDQNFLHEIEVVHTNAASGGITLYADRKVRARRSTQQASIKILDPPQFNLDGAPFQIELPDVAFPTPEQRQYTIHVESDLAAKSIWIAFTNSSGQASAVPASTNALTGTVGVNQGSKTVSGIGTRFDEEVSYGSVLRIGTNLMTVANAASASNLTLSSAYPGPTTNGLTAYRVSGNPIRVGNKLSWSFVWSNLTEGSYTIIANADTNFNTSTIEASARRTTTVIFREMVDSNPADYDDDDDGLYDGMEVNSTNLPGSNPETWVNGDVHIWQIYGKSDPLSPDTDGDGLPDGLELGWRGVIDPSHTDTNMDTNGDGFPNFRSDYDPPFFNTVPDNWDVPDYNFNDSRTKLIAGSMTDASNPDTDYDGLPDGIEDWDRNGWVNGDGAALAPGQAKGDRGSWPDGEIQSWETWTETDPNNWDTDGDGVSDGYGEDYDRNGWIKGDTDSNRVWQAGELWEETDPLNPDTDGDGLPDGWERQFGFDPFDDGVIGHTNMKTGAVVSDQHNGANGNPDNDTIVQGSNTNAYSNLLEFQNGTNPWWPDTGDESAGSVKIGRGDEIGSVNGVAHYEEFLDWTWDDCIILDEYEGAGGNDEAGDVYPGYTEDGNDGFDTSRDIVAFYARDGGNQDGKFYFRFDFYDLQAFAEDQFLNMYVVIDTGQPEFGEKNLPDDIDTITEMGWEAVVAIYSSGDGAVYVDTDHDNNTTSWGQALDGSVGVERRDQSSPNGFIGAYFNSEIDSVEIAINRQALLDAGWNGLSSSTLNYQIFTTKPGTGNNPQGAGDIGGRSDIRDSVLDDWIAEDYWQRQDAIKADSRLYSWVNGGQNSGRAKVSVIVHGNQGIQPGNVIQDLINDGDGAGYWRALKIHDLYAQPFNLHVTPTLASAIEWAKVDPAAGKPWLDGPSLNDWIATMIETNLIDLMASTFSDHMLPYFTADFIHDNEALGKEFLETIYHTTLTSNSVFWTPERLLDHDVFTKIDGLGYGATVLDQSEHLLKWYGRSEALGTRGYQINRISGVKTFAINNGASDFRFQNHDEGLSMPLRRLFIRKGLGDQDQVVTIFTGWEDFRNGVQADAYDLNMRWMANHPWIQLVTLEDILDGEVDITGDGIGDDFWYVAERGDLIGQSKLSHNYINFSSELSYDNWYIGSPQEEGLQSKVFEIRPGVDVSSAYGMLYTAGMVTDAWTQVKGIADTNAIGRLGRAAMHASVFETAFHVQDSIDLSKFSTGDYISPDASSNALASFAKIAQSQTRMSAVYKRVDSWLAVASGFSSPQVSVEDVDLDGEDEYLLFNDRIIALFERIGGRMVGAWVRDTASGKAYQVIGNQVSYAGRETEEEGAWNVSGGGSVESFRTSALKDWWAGTTAYVNELYSFAAESNGWTITSSDGKIQKQVSLDPFSEDVKVRYQTSGDLTGQAIYVRHGLSPNLYDLLVRGQANLSGEQHAGGVMTLVNNSSEASVGITIGYGNSGNSAGFNTTAVDDDPGAGHDFDTLVMRNQAQTHQVEVVGTNDFTFTMSFTATSSDPDTDNDGMPDSWEMAKFNDTTTADETTDWDKDGLKDWEEYVANTEPKDANSRLSFSAQMQNGSGVVLRFDTAVGRWYHVWYCDSTLDSGSWIKATAGAPIAGTGAEVQWADDGSMTAPPPSAAAKRYYNVEVLLP